MFIGERLNLLILFPRYYFEHKMSPVRRDVIRELLLWRNRLVAGLPRYHAILSGVGWPDYDESATAQENIDRIMPDCHAVLTYKPLGSREVPAMRNFASVRQLTIETFNECWHKDRRMMRAVKEANIRLVVLHHLNDMPRWADVKGPRIVHIPHCANNWIYAREARPWKERDIPVLLTGVLLKKYYPLRSRLAALIRSGRLSGKIYPHPGYRLSSLKACDRQQVEYAKLLGRAKLVLGCTSRFKYRLARIPEIAMAGALCVSDLPDQDREEHAAFMAELSADVSDDELVDRVRYWLEHDDKAAEKATLGRHIMMNRYTQLHYVTQLLWAIIDALHSLD